MKKLLFVLILIALGAFKQASATHIVGGELVYRHLGGSQYAVTLIIYRDCLSGAAAFDNPAAVGVFRANGTLFQTFNFVLDSVVTLQSTINSSCVTVPNNVCTEAGYYTEIVTLPPVVGGYTLSYQRCCRNAVIQNIQTPGDVGATYVATIPGSESSPNNSSPFWNNLPPLYVCANLPWQFNHSAFDADGDSLVYSLCTPYQGASTTAPQPSPPSTPPYIPILWEPPYGLSDMMGGTVPLTINPSTGQINATPNMQGTYVIGLCVREYRNGVLLGETTRGIQVNVVNCQAPVAIPDDLNEILPNSFINCTEFVEFSASNSSGFNILWDFGDPTTTSDQSNLQSPTWTYPGPGVYDLTLIVFNPTNPNDPLCTDTVVQQITVQDTVIPDAGSDLATCPGISVQIGTSGIQGWSYQWSPSTGLSNPNIAQPTASITQQITYTLTAIDAVGCSGSDAVTVSLLANAAASAGPDVQICSGATTQLQASGGVTYLWSPNQFIDNVTIANPNVNPQTTTSYIVEVTNLDGCIGFDTVQVSVPAPSISVSNDTTICIGDTIQLFATGGAVYSWLPNIEISNPSVSSPLVNPSVSRTYYVESTDGNGCSVSDSVTIFVQALPTAFAGFDQGVCGGGSVQLNATGGVIYQWTPTTGLSNPNIQNPVVTFSSDTVTYTVTVTDIIGCVDTDTVTVWQEPLPDAQAGPDTTICAGGTVQLNSSGGQTYTWTPTAGLNNPNTQNPTATPLTTTTYTVTVGQPTGNLVFNGNFSQGNVGFNSDYPYATNLVPAGLYGVVTNANDVHPAFQGTGHTGNAPLDSFMVVNGAGTPNLNVWCQTISVSPNTDYFFGAWVSTVVANNPAILQFSINGQVLGSPFSAPFNINNWVQFFQTWNSGSGTSATICVVNQNTTTGGNDFALDDITFSTFCTNTADVTVTVNPLPTANAGPDQSICIGETTQMAGSGGTSYQWVPPIALADPTNPTTNANPIITRTYTLIVQDNIGCEATDDMTLTVNPLPQASAGPDHEVCVGESVVLQGSGGTVYQWSPAIDLDDPNTQLPISTPSNSITYTLTVTDNNQCENTDQTTVTVNPLPIVDAGLDSMICANQTIILQASGADSYLWSPLVGLSDPQSANPSASPLNETIYYVTGTDVNGCVSSDSVSITIFSIFAGPDSIVCLNDSVLAFVSDGATFSWTPIEGVSDPTSASPYLNPDVSTLFTVTATSAFGCEATADVNIGILTLPISSFTAAFEPTCDGIYAGFENNSENSEAYYWSFGDGGASSEFEPTHTFAPGQGSFITLITYNNDSLCVDTIVVDYSGQWFGNDTIDIKYATVFTPNFDGINDCFKPGFDGRFSDCYDLQVFNRWGALIFESTGGQGHCWDGRTKAGKRCDEGTYYYMVSLSGYEKHGYVTLIY